MINFEKVRLVEPEFNSTLTTLISFNILKLNMLIY